MSTNGRSDSPAVRKNGTSGDGTSGERRPASAPTNGAGPRHPARPAIIRTQGLGRLYRLGDQWVRALDQVSTQILEGQFVGIMGPSGSGKSTLMHLMGGLDFPTEGTIEVAGQFIHQMSKDDLAMFRRDSVGFIFQGFHLVPTLNALENVALPGVFAGLPKEARKARASQLLHRLGMGDRLDHRPSQLSGGQQQRVAIARALFNNPPIIMADEPTGALDSKTGQRVMTMLRQLCSRAGKTIIVVSHDPGVATYADRMLYLQDGRIVGDELCQPAPARYSARRESA